MKYLHQILKLKKGTIIKVNFSEPTRVLLLSDHNYKKYKEHITYSYWGGMIKNSPFQVEIPVDGIWHVVVERGGYFNPKNIMASVSVLPD